MVQVLKYDLVPFEDYLTGEREVEIRSEYVDGLVYAMAGASRTHNTITSSFHALIETHLREEYRVWQSDMKTVIQHKGQRFAYYPDIMATCSILDEDEYICTNPILIVEVLSDSTESTDLKEKFDNYTTIPSLLEYVVVSQDVPLIRLWRRRTSWEREIYRAGEVFHLESIALNVPVEHIYRRVRKEVGLEIA
ncbi:Uma2 family endonuclease [Thiothrix eikelboomii]|uniref:Uma2 family endonuclease n=1 Tax=Thiothrix eikelboomii TaxID=92487 RepID=UPI003BAE56BC